MIKIIIFFVLTGMMYSQGLTGHYSSILKKRAGGSSILDLDGLIWLVDDDSLSNGAVSAWDDIVGSNDLAQATGSLQPTKGASGVESDGNDWMQDDNHNLAVTASFSLVVIAQIDTTLGNAWLLGIKDANRQMTVVFNENDDKLAALSYGVGYVHSDVRSSALHLTTTCIIVTRSATNGTRIYFDGVQQTEVSQYSGYPSDNNFITMFAYDYGVATVSPDGTIIRLGAYFDKELSQGDIDDIMDTDEVSGKLP